MSVREQYERELAQRGYQSDPAQLRAIEALDRCAREWAEFKEQRSNVFKKLINRPEIPRGVYMHGGVGRGKSFIMDCFYTAVPLARKTRLHFHEFMREVHREMAGLQGTVNPLDELGARIAKRYRLICFDEFHVADITDAMILHRLLDALFDNGVGFVTTSNFKPDDLYPNGLHRERVLPAIELLKEKLEVIGVDAGVYYRRRAMEQVELYHVPLGREADVQIDQAFTRLAEFARPKPRSCTSRPGKSAPGARPAGWCGSTSVRCAAGHARRTTTWRSPPSSTPCCSATCLRCRCGCPPRARRFTWLVDVLYDRRVKLVMSAQVPPEALYTEGPLAHEFPRTVSRLHEMQSAEYLGLEHRTVDTRLT